MSDNDISTITEADDPSLLPGTPEERAAEEAHGLSAIPASAVALLPGELLKHPSPFQYVVIAVILCVLTAAEVGMYYLEGSVPSGLIITVLLVMAFVKFVIVSSWYMHLRTDQTIFRRFFIMGGIGAILLYTIVLSTLHIFS